MSRVRREFRGPNGATLTLPLIPPWIVTHQNDDGFKSMPWDVAKSVAETQGKLYHELNGIFEGDVVFQRGEGGKTEMVGWNYDSSG